MIGHLGDHRHVGTDAADDQFVDTIQVVADEFGQRLDGRPGYFLIFEGNDNAQNQGLLQKRRDHRQADAASQAANCHRWAERLVSLTLGLLDDIMDELLRTNDAVLLSFAEALLKEAGIPVHTFDQNMSVLEGSIGVLTRRLLVPASEAVRAREILVEAGIGNELTRSGRAK